MKKKSLLIVLLIICNLCKAKHINFNSNCIFNDSTVIHQISFSRSGNPGNDYKDLLEKEQYTIIIEENGDVILKWNGKCPPSKNNTVICSYSGTIKKNQFSKLTNKLKKIKYTELQKLYVPLKEYEHVTSDIYIITYNNGVKKKIIDQNFEIDGLKEFREILIKLKKEIKWTPVKGFN